LLPFVLLFVAGRTLLDCAAETEIYDWEDREQSAPVEIEQPELQARELFCLVDQCGELKSHGALGSVVKARKLRADEIFYVVYQGSLNALYRFRGADRTDVDPIQIRVFSVEEVDPQAVNVGFIRKDLRGV
jgi:hypothetical protein